MTEVPCLRLGHMSEEEKRAYVLANNKLALNIAGLVAVHEMHPDPVLCQNSALLK